MKKAGAEIGLFYYYFNSKDEVFDIAVERFVESYRPGFDDAYAKGVDDPHQALSIYFEFVRRCTVEFRAKYGETLHWAVRRAIRERALEIMEPYLEKIIGLLVENGMQEPPVDRHEMGLHYGELLRKGGQDFSSVLQLSQEQRDFGIACLSVCETVVPELCQEIKGLAEGLMVSYEDLSVWLLTMYGHDRRRRAFTAYSRFRAGCCGEAKHRIEQKQEEESYVYIK